MTDRPPVRQTLKTHFRPRCFACRDLCGGHFVDVGNSRSYTVFLNLFPSGIFSYSQDILSFDIRVWLLFDTGEDIFCILKTISLVSWAKFIERWNLMANPSKGRPRLAGTVRQIRLRSSVFELWNVRKVSLGFATCTNSEFAEFLLHLAPRWV